ncbi:MAG: hypothetical protein DI537_17510 [Stutzerimonas stutzeri]|nr:MAG: hypothetical protein DI537_17510 [Stutzerimonas stutzeri]
MDDKRTIICAFAENASGPGWSNSLVWVIERDGNGRLHQRAIQPEEQTAEMIALFQVCAASNVALTKAVINAEAKKRRSTKAA